MHATAPTATHRPNGSNCRCYTVTVGTDACTVRAATVWPIHEVLHVEAEMVLSAGDAAGAALDDAELLVDLLASRMIAPPRPRRRRERCVSSRAIFYSGAEG